MIDSRSRLAGYGLLFLLIGCESSSNNAQRALDHGRKLITTGDYDEAILHLSHAIELAPENPVGFIERAQAYRKQFKHALAIQDLRRATQLQPNDFDLRFEFARLVEEHGKPDEARREYSDLIRSEEKLIPALLGRSRLLALALDYDNALKDLNRIIESENPEGEAEAYYLRGVIFDKKGNARSAMSDLSTAIRLDPSNASAYIRRARLFEIKGQMELAQADRDLARAIDSSVTFLDAEVPTFLESLQSNP